MTSQPQPLAWSSRLADQLQVLSEVAESLTYRLLDLEERLAVQEQHLLEQAEAGDSPLAEEMEQRLLDTEDRLARIEGLLTAGEASSALRPGQPLRLASAHSPVGSPPRVRQAGVSAAAEVRIPQEDPFLDEGEQPFMDELIA